MKRLFAALTLLAVLGGAGWYYHWKDVRAGRAWRSLPGGGEVRLYTITHGEGHPYSEPSPTLWERISTAVRTRSLRPSPKPSPISVFSQYNTGCAVWLELRGAPAQQDAELILPSGQIFSSGAGGGSGMAPGHCYAYNFFNYAPMRARTLRYACKIGEQRVEFEFDNPMHRTDLSVWKGSPLPQTQQKGPLTLTLRGVNTTVRNIRDGYGTQWTTSSDLTIRKNGELADQWFDVTVNYEDPSGQTLYMYGSFDEPVWKLRCSLARTNDYPFRDDEVQWLGTVSPDAPLEQSTRLFPLVPNFKEGGVRLAGVFGPGEYQYRDGALVGTASVPPSFDPESDEAVTDDEYESGLMLITLVKPAVVVFGDAFVIFRDAEGHPVHLENHSYDGGSLLGDIQIYEFPKAPTRVGAASSEEPNADNFEFFIPTPEKPGLKRTTTKP